ncbi:hypothetical protein J1N35_018823 [Gossypium stocksii]|uniref:Uncharacterized protein n=1 Tax=Gossypium stocksii TaxID=47602 RepID=A0A9D3VPT1_9ROSI|nr:hypothetical protein J1N35_018823 [Gossypium stocksii]
MTGIGTTEDSGNRTRVFSLAKRNFTIHSPSFCLSVSVSAQQSALAVGVLSDALRPIILDNACILCITVAAGTELADAYSPDTIIASSPGKEVQDPWAFYLHAALLRQAFAHQEVELTNPKLKDRKTQQRLYS